MTYHTGKQYIIAALLLVIAIEGAIIAMDSDSNEEDYSAFIDKIDELNEKGGRFGSTTEITTSSPVDRT